MDAFIFFLTQKGHAAEKNGCQGVANHKTAARGCSQPQNSKQVSTDKVHLMDLNPLITLQQQISRQPQNRKGSTIH